MKIKQEIEAELFGEDQNWGRGESNVSFFVFVFFSLALTLGVVSFGSIQLLI